VLCEPGQLTIIVCGGRHYDNRPAVAAVLDRMRIERGICLIAHGGATGADALADDYAKQFQIPCRSFPADWRLGPSAGPRRNKQMLEEIRPDRVVAFPGDTGTADMVRRALKAGVVVWQPYG
jgi:hypothetical protein